MGLDRIYTLAKRVEQRLHCSREKAEYMASIPAWEVRLSKPRFELRAEIRAVHSLGKHSAV